MVRNKLRGALLVVCLGGSSLAWSQPLPPPPPILNPAALQAELRARSGSDTVYFSAQGYGLDASAIRVLTAQAAWLRANPAIMVRLDGHADQNDTRDYAFGIAERRAAGVRDLLVTLGVAPVRLSIASWGKERPGTMRIGISTVGIGPRVVTTVR
jgi:peptidoglycan-associated lipoprotein